MSKALQALIESINSQITALNDNGFKIYDDENPEYFLNHIYYSEDDNELYFKCNS